MYVWYIMHVLHKFFQIISNKYLNIFLLFDTRQIFTFFAYYIAQKN